MKLFVSNVIICSFLAAQHPEVWKGWMSILADGCDRKVCKCLPNEEDLYLITKQTHEISYGWLMFITKSSNIYLKFIIHKYRY